MKKVCLVIVSLLCVTTAFAGQGDGYLSLNGGFLFNSTLNATVGYERELSYTDALEALPIRSALNAIRTRHSACVSALRWVP